jgi:hypothetical protein
MEKQKLARRTKLLYAVALLLVPAGCAVVLNSEPDMPEKPRTYETEALTCAKSRIKEMLKSPRTAKFPWGSDEATIKLLEGTTFEVSSYVDAENSFGAMLRTNYTCLVTYTPDTSMCETRCKLNE